MMKRASATVVTIALAAGCSGSPTPPPTAAPAPPNPVAVASIAPAAAAPRPVGAVQMASPAATESVPLIPSTPPVPESSAPGYDSRGRRDPFAEIHTTSGTTGLSVATTKLTGIVRSPRSTLALVETTDGIGYILRPGDTLGDGRLVEIGSDIVVFAVAAKPGSTSNKVVLRLAAN